MTLSNEWVHLSLQYSDLTHQSCKHPIVYHLFCCVGFLLYLNLNLFCFVDEWNGNVLLIFSTIILEQFHTTKFQSIKLLFYSYRKYVEVELRSKPFCSAAFMPWNAFFITFCQFCFCLFNFIIFPLTFFCILSVDSESGVVMFCCALFCTAFEHTDGFSPNKNWV